MPASKRIHTISILWYICCDYVAAMLSANIFHFSRRFLLSEPIFIRNHLILTQRFWLGAATLPIAWLILFTIAGSYQNLYQKSRLNELTNTFITCLIGCTIIFFAIDEAGDERIGQFIERSEEHTSELQSPDHLVCRLLPEKKRRYTESPPLS